MQVKGAGNSAFIYLIEDVFVEIVCRDHLVAGHIGLECADGIICDGAPEDLPARLGDFLCRRSVVGAFPG